MRNGAQHNTQAALLALADLLEYPGADWPQRLELIADSLGDQTLAEFSRRTASLPLASLQETYTQTFDLNPVATLEIGYHLFGENYKRGLFLAQLRETVELAGPEAAILFLQCDVGSLSEIEGVVDFIERFDRPVDILVHAEGVQVRGGIEHGSVNDLDEQYLVNVRGPYLMSQRLLAQLRAGRGHVVFVNPAPSSEGAIDFGQFAVTTDSVRSLADTLRREVQTSGVRVTSIRPEAPTTDVAAETVVALSPHDIADSVLHAVQVPGQVEITDITLRPRSA